VLVDWLGEVVINLPFIVFVDCENVAFVEWYCVLLVDW
jgi:hypothetical protein